MKRVSDNGGGSHRSPLPLGVFFSFGGCHGDVSKIQGENGKYGSFKNPLLTDRIGHGHLRAHSSAVRAGDS